MNEELQSKLVEILKSMQDAAKATGDFAMQQLPDIAQSYVMYGRIWNTVALLLIAAVIGTSLRISWIYKKQTDGISFLMAFFVSFPLSIAFFCFLEPTILVWFAPKVWLIKEIAGMLK